MSDPIRDTRYETMSMSEEVNTVPESRATEILIPKPQSSKPLNKPPCSTSILNTLLNIKPYPAPPAPDNSHEQIVTPAQGHELGHQAPPPTAVREPREASVMAHEQQPAAPSAPPQQEPTVIPADDDAAPDYYTLLQELDLLTGERDAALKCENNQATTTGPQQDPMAPTQLRAPASQDTSTTPQQGDSPDLDVIAISHHSPHDSSKKCKHKSGKHSKKHKKNKSLHSRPERYTQKGKNPSEKLTSSHNYAQWKFAVCLKFSDDAPLFSNDGFMIRYALHYLDRQLFQNMAS
ncbi:hypothetical protein KEM55_001928 [Ascosphaera atra]|nr:hypothetical protein KEM55_001928 [Ascosphaera atra]